MSLTISEFELLLSRGENQCVDFKEFHYFNKSETSNKEKTYDLMKDILCMCNTIRTTSAYILIGVKEDSNGKGIAVGILSDDVVDDAVLQQKIKNKTFPGLKFNSYTLKYYESIICVIEIPVAWYERIPIPTITSKGIEFSRVYTRRGTTNDVANSDEIIQIDHWFKSLSMLPGSGNYRSIQEFIEPRKVPSIKKTNPTKVSFDEVSIQNLFGNEAAEDEDPSRLKEYYFKNETYDSIAVNLPIRILVGHKGIGKSALFKISAAEDLENQIIPIIIKPDDVTDLAQGQNDFLQLIRAWKVGIIEIIRNKLLLFFRSETDLYIKNRENLNDFDVQNR